MVTKVKATEDDLIKEQKGAYWSEPGAGIRYYNAAFARNGIVKLKTDVERALVRSVAKGRVLDAGTGTGRFALDLAEDKSNRVIAADFSREMLNVNRHLREEHRVQLQYVQCDVEKLPFRNDTFDSVVSITVIRHFPQFRSILKEYLRVLKRDGVLVFEMCSGDHLRAANSLRPRFGMKFSEHTFAEYELEMEFGDLRPLLETLGASVIWRQPYDVLNNNAWIQLALGKKILYRLTMKVIELTLRVSIIRRFAGWIERTVLPGVSTKVSYNYMVAARKG